MGDSWSSNIGLLEKLVLTPSLTMKWNETYPKLEDFFLYCPGRGVNAKKRKIM